MSQYPRHASISFLDLVWEYKFLLVFYILGISFITFFVLFAFNAVPEELAVLVPEPDDPIIASAQTNNNGQQTKPVTEEKGELPIKLVIKKVGIETVVYNPEKSDNRTLNNNLLKGAVRYPGSGLLGTGNVFIFGHSSGLRIVNNQAFRTFNKLKDLVPGDEIVAYSQGREYVYKVSSVVLVDSDKALVDFGTNKNMLTISTCNVFGEKQERYVVEAAFSNVRNRSGL